MNKATKKQAIAMLHHGTKIQSEKLNKAIKIRDVINFMF
jgi:hypothetical protein